MQKEKIINLFNIAIILSVLINLILLGYVIGYMSVFLFLSILTNMGLGWFIYKILNYQNELEDDLETLSGEAQDLKLHIKSIYELDMFYGDDTLQSMLEHMNRFSEDVDYYIGKYSTEEDSEEEYQYDTDEAETP
tara:strand:- start:2955 stop:3359 length:405 start_codon:yes stop_codon:yes gene_type:complete